MKSPNTHRPGARMLAAVIAGLLTMSAVPAATVIEAAITSTTASHNVAAALYIVEASSS